MKKLLFFIVVAAFSVGVQAQATKKNIRKTTTKPASTPLPPMPEKRNERPDDTPTPQTEKTKKVGAYMYEYTFTQPEFIVAFVEVFHNDDGTGKIRFKKKDNDEFDEEPLSLSQVTMDKLREAFAALNFIDSNEDYQYEKDYSHMGNMSFTVRHENRSRTAKYNYTTNKNAKALADEYRRITNQVLWVIDMDVARANQPLETPSMVDALDSYLQRNEISDPVQLSVHLKKLVSDEHIPLLARNKMSKLIKNIELKAQK